MLRWRKAERQRLIEERLAIDAEERKGQVGPHRIAPRSCHQQGQRAHHQWLLAVPRRRKPAPNDPSAAPRHADGRNHHG